MVPEPPGGRAALTRLQRLSLQGESWLLLQRGLLESWAQHAAATLTRLVITNGGVPFDWQRTAYSRHDPREGPQHGGMLAPLACLRALRSLALDGAHMRPRLELHGLEGPHRPTSCRWRCCSQQVRVLASQHAALAAGAAACIAASQRRPVHLCLSV